MRALREPSFQPTTASDAPPAVADHVMLRRIGVGAYGEVWMAQSITGALRAVKVVFRERFDHEKTYEREFVGLKNFEPVSRGHEGLVDVLQVGRHADYFYSVMELADSAALGEEYVPLTLSEYIKGRGRLAVAECAQIGADVAEALAFLHRNGLVHRDIKPSNIIFVNERPKLADIGLVTNVGAARSFVGTDGFIPPEGPGTPSGDIYGLGKCLYEMATGKSRLDFPDLPPNLEASREGAGFTELNEIILRSCATTPEERHASAAELRSELLLLQAGKSIRKLRRNERLLTVWRRVGLAALAVLILAAAGFAWERKRAEIANREAAAQAQQRQLIEEKERRARENLYAADMNLAQQAIAAGNYGRAQSLLAAYIPASPGEDLRGFEWFYYSQVVQGDSVGVLKGHEQVVSCLALTPDGERILSASFDSTIRDWSLAERRELRRWTLPGCMFSAVSLNRAGTLLACEGGNRRFSAVLNLETGAWSTNISNESSSVAFAPGERQLVRGANSLIFDTNGVVEITDLDFTARRTLPEAGGRAAFQPGGRLLATGSWGDAVKLWSWPELELRGVLKGAGNILGMQFSPDGKRLATVARDGRLALWDVESSERIQQRVAHGGAVVWCVAFSADGKRLATGGNDQAVRTWDAETLTETHAYRGHGSEVWSVIWSRDGEKLISAGKDATIRIWNANPREQTAEILDVAQRPVFSKDGRWVAARSRVGGVRVWELRSGTSVAELADAVEAAGFSDDGEGVIVLGRGGSVQERTIKGGKVEASGPACDIKGGYTKRIVSAKGRWVAAGYRTGEVLVYDGRVGGSARKLDGHREMILALAISQDERRLLTGGIDRTARLWDLESGREVHVFRNHKMGVGSLAFSPDGLKIATGSWDDSLHVWDAASGAELLALDGHDSGVQAVEFAPDGRTLLALTGTSVLKIWNLPAQREAGQVQLRPGVRQGWLAVSDDGQWLGAVSQAETLRLLHAPKGNY